MLTIESYSLDHPCHRLRTPLQHHGQELRQQTHLQRFCSCIRRTHLRRQTIKVRRVRGPRCRVHESPPGIADPRVLLRQSDPIDSVFCALPLRNLLHHEHHSLPARAAARLRLPVSVQHHGRHTGRGRRRLRSVPIRSKRFLPAWRRQRRLRAHQHLNPSARR